MKVGFDAKRAFFNQSGLGNYSRLIVNEVAKQPHVEVFAYAKARSKEYQPKNVRTQTPQGLYTLFPRAWRSKGIIADLERDTIDVFHGLSNELPLGIAKSKVASVVSIHDLIFLRFPELYKSYDRAIYRKKVRASIQEADRVVAISEQTQMDILNFFEIDPSKIKVIYQDCDPQFRRKVAPEEIEAVKRKYQLPSEYLLSVGTIQKRKNQLLILQAAKELEVPVVLIGKQTAYVKELEDYVYNNQLKERVFFLDQVSFSDFPAIYQAASVFMYPSLYEGFGIPILEALRSKVPVITSKGSCFVETGGEYSKYITNSVEEAKETLELVLGDSALQEKMVSEGITHASQFDVEKTTPQLLQLYKNICS